jgi:hypothetical protein
MFRRKLLDDLYYPRFSEDTGMTNPRFTLLVLTSMSVDVAFAYLFRYQAVIANSPKGGIVYKVFAMPWFDANGYLNMFFAFSSILWATAILRPNPTPVVMFGLAFKALLLVAPILSGRVGLAGF